MLRTAFLCTLALGCAAAWAQDPTPQPVPATAPAATTAPAPAPSDLRKFYLGPTLGRSDGVDEDPALDDDVSYGFTAGMRLDSRWAVEVFWRNFAFGADFGDAVFGGDGNFRPETHVGLAGIYRLPMGDNVSAYARLGLGETDLVANRNGLFEENSGQADRKSITDPSVGAGVEIGTLRRVGVKLEATRFTKSAVKTYLLGLDIKF